MQIIPQCIKLNDDERKHLKRYIERKKLPNNELFQEAITRTAITDTYDFYMGTIWLSGRSPKTADEFGHIGFGRVGVGLEEFVEYLSSEGYILFKGANSDKPKQYRLNEV